MRKAREVPDEQEMCAVCTVKVRAGRKEHAEPKMRAVGAAPEVLRKQVIERAVPKVREKACFV